MCSLVQTKCKSWGQGVHKSKGWTNQLATCKTCGELKVDEEDLEVSKKLHLHLFYFTCIQKKIFGLKQVLNFIKISGPMLSSKLGREPEKIL